MREQSAAFSGSPLREPALCQLPVHVGQRGGERGADLPSRPGSCFTSAASRLASAASGKSGKIAMMARQRSRQLRTARLEIGAGQREHLVGTRHGFG